MRSVPKAGRPREHVKNHGRACTQVLFLNKAELRFFYFLEIVTGWLAPSAGQKILVLAGTFHPKRSPLLKAGFFIAGKGAENTKEKSRQCFRFLRNTDLPSPRYL